MMNRILKKIRQKSRLEEYKSILQYALKNDYKIVSLYDWYENYKTSSSKILILRHDVDYDTKGAYAMYKIEKMLGVHSTFYFRWSSMNDKLMREMNKNGFEISLHFETLADYAKANKIYKSEEVDNKVVTICQQKLSEEIELFEKKFWKIHTICSHGDKRNRVLSLPNHIIWNEAIKNKYRILFETYEKSIIGQFDAYISDSSIYRNFEWQHYGSPIDAIDKNRQTICLLTHPIHWNQSFFNNIRMLSKVYFDNRN